jgi:hypothetical protein
MSSVRTHDTQQCAKDDYLRNVFWENGFPLRTLTFQNDVDERRWKFTVSGFASLEDIVDIYVSRNENVVKCNVFPCLKDQEETSFKNMTGRTRGRSHVFRLVPNEEGYVTVHIPQKEEFNVFQKEMENRLIPENKVTVCVESIETPCHISKKDEEACWVRRETEKRLAEYKEEEEEDGGKNMKRKRSDKQLERLQSKIRRTLRAERALFADSDDEDMMIDDVSHHMDSEFLYDWKIVKHLEEHSHMVLIERNGVQRGMDWRYLRPIVETNE